MKGERGCVQSKARAQACVTTAATATPYEVVEMTSADAQRVTMWLCSKRRSVRDAVQLSDSTGARERRELSHAEKATQSAPQGTLRDALTACVPAAAMPARPCAVGAVDVGARAELDVERCERSWW